MRASRLLPGGSHCSLSDMLRSPFLSEDSMLKSELLRLLLQEIHRHDFSYFVDNPPSMAQRGKGVVVPGCPACMVRINTMPQFLDHLANDVLPKVIDTLSSQRQEPTQKVAP